MGSYMHGMRLALLSRWDVESEVRAVRWAPIKLEDGERKNLPIWTMMPTTKNVPTRVGILVEVLQERLKDYFRRERVPLGVSRLKVNSAG